MSNPTGIGGAQKGEARNPSGISEAQRKAREAVREWLASEDTRLKGLRAYARLLDAENPLIVKDFMDRIAGKVKEHVEVEGSGLADLVREMLGKSREDVTKEAK